MIIRRIEGESMLPSLKPGSIVLLGMPRKIKVGDIVMIHHQGLEKIKRVTRYKDSRIFVEGDNKAQSTDSRHFGWLDTSDITAKLLWPRI